MQGRAGGLAVDGEFGEVGAGVGDAVEERMHPGRTVHLRRARDVIGCVVFDYATDHA